MTMLSIAGLKSVKIQNLFENNSHFEEIRVSEYLYQAESNSGLENCRHSRKTRTACAGISRSRENSFLPENLSEGRTSYTQHNHKENTQPDDDNSYEGDGPVRDDFNVDSVDALSSGGDCVLVENQKLKGGQITKRAYRSKKVVKNLEKVMTGNCMQLVVIDNQVAEPMREEEIVTERLESQVMKSTHTYKEMLESVNVAAEKFCDIVSAEFSCASVSRMTPIESEGSDSGNERLRFEESDQGTPKLPENSIPDPEDETSAQAPTENVQGGNELFESCGSVTEVNHLSSDVSLVTAEFALCSSEQVLVDDSHFSRRHCSSVSVIAVPCMAFSSFTAMSMPEENMFSHAETHSKNSNDSDKSKRAPECGLIIPNDDLGSKKLDPAKNLNRGQRKSKDVGLRRKLNPRKQRQLDKESTNQVGDESNQIGTETLNIFIINHEIPILNQGVVDNTAACSVSELDQYCHTANSAPSTHTESGHPVDFAPPGSRTESCHPVDLAPSSCTESCHPVDSVPSSYHSFPSSYHSVPSTCTEVLACETSEPVQHHLAEDSDPTDHQLSPEIPVSHKALRSLDKLYPAARRTAELKEVPDSSSKRRGRRSLLTASRGMKRRSSAEKTPATSIIKSDKRKSKSFRGKTQKRTSTPVVEIENVNSETEMNNTISATETEPGRAKLTRRRSSRKGSRKTVLVKSTGRDSEEDIQTIGELQITFSNVDSGEHSDVHEDAQDIDSLTDFEMEPGMRAPSCSQRFIVDQSKPVASSTTAELTEPEAETRKAAGGKSSKGTKSAKSATASAPSRPTQSSSTPVSSSSSPTASQLRTAKRDNKKNQTATKSQNRIQKHGIITPPTEHITTNESGDAKFSSTIMKAINDLIEAGCTDIHIHYYQKTENSVKKLKLKVDIGSNPVQFIPVGSSADASDSEPPTELPARPGSGLRKRKSTWTRSRSTKQMKDGRKKDGDNVVVTPNKESKERRLSQPSPARSHSSVHSAEDFVSFENVRDSTTNGNSSSKMDGQSSATFKSPLKNLSSKLPAEQPASSAGPDVIGGTMDQRNSAGPAGGGGKRKKRGSKGRKYSRPVVDGANVCLEAPQEGGPTQGPAVMSGGATVSEAVPIRLWASQDIITWLRTNGFDKIVKDFSTFEGPSFVELVNRVSSNSETITQYFHSLGLSLPENMRLCSCLNSLASLAAL